MRPPREEYVRPVYKYRRTFTAEELGRATDLFNFGRKWGHWSDRTRHSGPVAYVADQLGLPYDHAARLVWDAFQEGLLTVVPRWDDKVGARIGTTNNKEDQ